VRVFQACSETIGATPAVAWFSAMLA